MGTGARCAPRYRAPYAFPFLPRARSAFKVSKKPIRGLGSCLCSMWFYPCTQFVDRKDTRGSDGDTITEVISSCCCCLCSTCQMLTKAGGTGVGPMAK